MQKAADITINRHLSYPVWTGNDQLNSISSQWFDRFEANRIAIVVDENVEKMHGQRIRSELLDGFAEVISYTLPEGEQSKSIKQWSQICDRFLGQKIRRSTPLVAIGGGVTGDLAGFVAATVLRGIPLIHVPTTLLAMVDSAIGGKTGVNHETGKNLIGSFYQPEAVYEDLSFLTTLERKEWVNGLSEILKYAAIADEDLFETCASLTGADAFQDVTEWVSPIRKSALIKADIVEQDARESGIRAYLNFGHTFAHALEGYTNYGRFSHGEAVFLGMHAALFTSKEAGADIDMHRLEEFNRLYDLNIGDLTESVDELIQYMYYDKKIVRDTLKLVLLQEWEHPYVTEWHDHDILRQAWQFAFNQFT